MSSESMAQQKSLLTQDAVDELLALQINNARNVLRTNELNPDAANRISDSAPHQVGREDKQETITYLASVSKFVICLAQVEKVPEEVIVLNPKFVTEAIGRSPGHFLECPEYADLEITEEVRHYQEKLLDEQSKEARQIFDDIKQKLNQQFPPDGINLSRGELFYQALTLSNNTATTIIKGYSAYDDYKERVIQLTPDFEPLATTEQQSHWLQHAPNAGLISEHSALLDSTVKRSLEGNTNEKENEILNCLKNNPENFGFDFTHSELGEKLRAQGWDIYEKTGYYPAVYWVHGLAEPPLNLPVHMSLCTIVTLVNSQTGEVISFDHHINVAVAYPNSIDERLREETGIAFPDEWSPAYVKYTNIVKDKYARIFREELSTAVAKALQTK